MAKWRPADWNRGQYRDADQSSMYLLDLNSTSAPEVRLCFTDISLLADTPARRQIVGNNATYPVNPFALVHSQVRGGYQDFNDCSNSGTVLAWTNNLFERCTILWTQSDSA